MLFDSIDKKLMSKAISVAARGIPNAFPNPAVGCVICYDNEILSTGYHQEYGGKHAEYNALKKISNTASGLTMYVTLEPCNHKGKTDPCQDLIHSSVFDRIVIADSDPNQKASGSIEKLRQKGIKVDVGLLKKDARKINSRFYTFHEKKRPYVILKYASTLDGFVADGDGTSKWITNQKSRMQNHYTRSTCDAIIVGRRTAMLDNPSLGSYGYGKDPKIIVIDPKKSLGRNLNLFKKEPIIYSRPILKNSPVKNVSLIMHDLYAKNIKSVLVEGGAKTISSFLDAGLYDELHCYIAPKFLGSGLNIFQGQRSINCELELELIETKIIDNDVRIIYRNLV